MEERNFVHLHVHTEYSLLDGACRLEPLIQRAKDMNMTSLAITDHGVMYGAVAFYKLAHKHGIKPIMGCEIYVAPRSLYQKEPRIDDANYHLVLLAENNQGYRNLLRLISIASVEGLYYKPRVDLDCLKKYSRGLIALSGCLAGQIPQLILKGQMEEAEKQALSLQNVFGKDNFFLEIQEHGIEEQKRVNSQLVKISKRTGISLVATNDTHYINKEDAQVHDVLLCIQTGKKVSDTDRMTFNSHEFYLKSPEEMNQLFSALPESLENTVRIAERCQIELDFNHMHLPAFPIPKGYDDQSYLRELCWKGLAERYAAITPEIRERYEYELGIIEKMGYASYFLIVWDFIAFARSQNIPVGPGRGSAAGSLAAYALRITDIDPMKYHLLFERFLNPDRVTMPDIDVDFCYDRRDEVIQYVTEKYGQENVAQIITFGTMAARGAIRDIGRALDMPYVQVDQIAKLIPGELGITLDKALQTSIELRNKYEKHPDVKKLIDLAKSVEGMPRHASIHAAGVLIAKENIVNYVPLQKTPDGSVITQFTMDKLEELGLLKMDFLGLRTLTVIHNALKIIAKTHWRTVDIYDISLDDAKTYEMLSQGNTIGVFQLESDGMRKLIRDLKPSNLEHLTALLALYRPGPLGSGMVDDFIKGKNGEKEIEYLHPSLKPVLQDTFGVILYQEQVMRIASVLAGFTLGQADLLRRAMGKKKPEVIAGLRQKFIEGAQARNVSKDLAGHVFDLMAHFAGYGFNKSHSCAYAMVSYQTAYLKAHYPLEYMASLLTSVMDHTEKVAFYVEECRQMGIAILPPDINESLINFTVAAESIRFGLAAIKNVGKNAVEEMIVARHKEGKFISLETFCQRVDSRLVNTRTVESLIRAGAFESVHTSRSYLLSEMEYAFALAEKKQQELRSGQVSLFDIMEEEVPDIDSSSRPKGVVREFSFREILEMEKELMGLYISGNPLDPYRQILHENVRVTTLEVKNLQNDVMTIIGGMIASIKEIMTKKGKTMAFMTIEDFVDSVEVIVFPRVYSYYRERLKEGAVLLIAGHTSEQNDEVKVIGERIKVLNVN